jgi:hypothetical protein
MVIDFEEAEAATNACPVNLLCDTMHRAIYTLGLVPPCTLTIRDGHVRLIAKAVRDPSKADGFWCQVEVHPVE